MGERESILARIRLLRRRVKARKSLLRRIGGIMRDTSRKAFEERRLGELLWAKLYPNQKAPFLSIAGALEDFSRGLSAPKEKRFDQEPSLATGIRREIYESLHTEVVSENVVELYAHHPFARSAQEGSKAGDFVVPITDSTKKAIRNWLYDRRFSEGEHAKKTTAGYEEKLKGLLAKDEYTQPALARPFLGITDFAEERIADEIRAHFERSA